MELSYVKVFLDWEERTETLSDAEKGRLMTAIVQYAKSGIQPDLQGAERHVFPTFRLQIDRDKAELDSLRATRSESGKKGGRPKKAIEANGFSEKQKNQMVFSESKKSKEERKKKKEKEDDVVVGFMTEEEMDIAATENTINNKKIIDAMENAGMNTSNVAIDAVIDLGVEYGVERVVECIEKAALHNKEKAVSVAYVKAFLEGEKKPVQQRKPLKIVRAPEGWTG